MTHLFPGKRPFKILRQESESVKLRRLKSRDHQPCLAGTTTRRTRGTRLEDMPLSKVAETYLSIWDSTTVWFGRSIAGMVGTGRVSIAAASELSRAVVEDVGDAAPLAVKGLASLGCGGLHSQNEERDLHRWVKGLYQLELETYDVLMKLQVSCPHHSRSCGFSF